MSDLHVREHGTEHADAAVFLLLHAGVADSRAWDPVATRLAQARYRTIAPDLRGFGQSPDPTGDFRHTEDVLALLDSRGVTRPVVLVGWSMSGTIALDFALEHPDRVLGLVLVCSVPEGHPRSPVVLESWELEEQLLESGDVDGAIRNDIQTWGAGPTRSIDDLDPEIVDYMSEVARDQEARHERGTGQALDGDRDAISRLGELQCPLLVITADHDTPCHGDAATVLLDGAPNATRVHVMGTAHMAPLEDPGSITQAIAVMTR